MIKRENLFFIIFANSNGTDKAPHERPESLLIPGVSHGEFGGALVLPGVREFL
jgi:hypothetical protein